MKHFTVTFEPDGKQITIHSGATLIEAAGQAGIILNTTCGGKGTCKKCKVLLAPKSPEVPAPDSRKALTPDSHEAPAPDSREVVASDSREVSTPDSSEALASDSRKDLASDSREALASDSREVLACEYRVECDVTVTIPLEVRFFEQRILKHGVDAKIDVRPNVFRKYGVGDSGKRILGVAVDIGTTTVVAKLVDMAEAETVATAAMLNPQTKFGDDVISRITFGSSDQGLADLHKTIIDCLNDLIGELCVTASIEPGEVYEVCIVGNTTMNHVFLKLPIVQLGQAPYEAHSLDACDVTPEALGVNINPGGNIHTVENIAGFVGADTIGVGLAVDIGSAEEMTLAVDIGTNGEIILGTRDKLVAASCAAGPAFEGARISQGGRAADGAIEAVVINHDDIVIDVIGDAPARSICGSGLIDAVAVMLELGIIDHTGRFSRPDDLTPAIAARLTVVNDQPAFILAAGETPVILTQRDIRETQLAKAAIRAGIKLLQKQLGLEDEGILHIYLAGAFGNYINPASALKIGLLPDVPLERIQSIGNAAVIGAQMTLISNQSREAAGDLAGTIQYVEIAHDPQFQDVYADSMFF